MTPLRYRFHTYEFSSVDIHLRTLRDRRQFHDPEGVAESGGVSTASWPMFGVMWLSGEVLAHLMEVRPLAGLKVLEVGCGIGLASQVANQRNADITASDHHPLAQEFLDYNCRLNENPRIPFLLEGWGDLPATAPIFDLVIGSDLLYEPNHARMLASFIHRKAKPTATAIIVDPGRGNAAAFRRNMADLGFSHHSERVDFQDELTEPFNGHIHYFERSVS